MSPIVECLVAFLFGSVVGLLMQRSRFCNTAALRDAIMFRTYRNTKAMLMVMMILTVAFTGFMSLGAGHPMEFDVGLNTFAGLFLFGVHSFVEARWRRIRDEDVVARLKAAAS